MENSRVAGKAATRGSGQSIGLVREKKGPVAAPKSVDFVARIPLTSLGKPDKKAVRALYWNAEGRQVN